MSSLPEPVLSSWSQVIFKKKVLEKKIVTLEFLHLANVLLTALYEKSKGLSPLPQLLRARGTMKWNAGVKRPPPVEIGLIVSK